MDLKTTVQSLLKRLDRPAPDRHVRFRALVRRVVRRQLRIHLLLFLDQCRSIATRWQAMNLPGWPLDGRFRLAIGGMSRASFYLERLEPRLHFTWIGATSGNANNSAHDYDNLLNWVGGIIDNNFSTVTLSSNTTIYVAASTPTLGGFNLGYAGNYDLTFESSSSTAQTLTLNGGITGDFGGSANDRTVTFGSAANPLNLNLNGGSRTLNVNAGDTLLLQNVLANGTLIKTGSGTLTLAGANTYAGGTTLSAGTLDINNAAALGTGTLTIDGGTTIDNTSGSAITLSDNNAQNWNGNFTFAGTDDLNLGTGAVTMGASRTVTIANGNLAVGGDIAGGSNTLSVSGSGRLTLSGANTLGSVSIADLTGGTSIVRAASGSALGSGTVVINGASTDGTLELSGGITISNPISFWGHSAAAIGIESVSGDNTLSGAITLHTGGSYYPIQSDSGAGLTLSNSTLLASTPTGSRVLDLQGGGVGTISGAIANDSAVVSINDLSTGNWTLGGANTFSGGTTLSSGTLNLNSAIAPGTGALIIDGGTLDNTSGSAISLSNNNAQIWDGNFTFAGSNALNMGSGTVTLGANVQLTVAASTLTEEGIITGAFSLSKAGAGTFAVVGASVFSGGNTIDAGTELVNNTSGSGTGSGNVTVNSGGILGGDGIIAGPVNVNSGGTLAPGSSGTAIFATGNLTIASGGDLDAVINSSTAGSGYDQIDVTGTVNLSGSTLNLSGTRPIHLADQITLISNDAADAVAGTFNGLPEGASVTLNGANYRLNYEGGDGNDVVLTDNGPYVAAAALATPSPVTGTSTDLSVLGSDEAGEAALTYVWSVTSVPPGAADPTFSVNDSNAAKITVATFTAAGTYVLEATITDPGGSSTTSSV